MIYSAFTWVPTPQVKKAVEPVRLNRKQVAKNRFVKVGGGVDV